MELESHGYIEDTIEPHIKIALSGRCEGLIIT